MENSSHLYKILLMVWLICWSTVSFAQAPVWAWAQSSTATSANPNTIGTATDAAGYVYSAGIAYIDSISFGSYQLGKGMFLVKHSSQGNLVWAIGGMRCEPSGLATDLSGNCYLTGRFSDTLILGADTLICRGKWDIFTARFDNSGAVVWARRAGGAAYAGSPWPILSEDEGRAIGVDASGNCYVGANIVTTPSMPVTFDTITIAHSPPPGGGLIGSLSAVAKYNAAGQIQWVRKIEGTGGNDPARAIAVSAQGDCFAMGSFSYTISYNGTTLTSNGQGDVCYAKYDAAGNFIWARSFGGPELDYGEGIAVSQEGEIYLTGTFADTMQVGNFILAGDPGANPMFVVKCDSSGSMIWASQTSGTGAVSGPRIVVDLAGNSYISCSFADSVNVGQELFVSFGSHHDPMVLKWSDAGTPMWVRYARGASHDRGTGIALSPDHKACYLAGHYFHDLDFWNFTLNGGNAINFFLAKLENIVNVLPDEVSADDLSAYPNPAHRRLHLRLPEPCRNATLSLTNIAGQQVYSAVVSALYETVLDLPQLPQGTYILTLRTEKQVLRKKLVLQP